MLLYDPLRDEMRAADEPSQHDAPAATTAQNQGAYHVGERVEVDFGEDWR